MEWLNIVAKHHKEWVSVVRSWGMGDISEDFVQEMYIKLHDKVDPDKIIIDGHVNKFFIYVVLRNMFNDYHNERKKVEKVRIGTGFEILDECELEEKEAFNRVVDIVIDAVNELPWFDKKMLLLYGKTDLSMRDIQKGTNISVTSIFNTIKESRQAIKEKCEEDYQDYRNGDYDRI